MPLNMHNIVHKTMLKSLQKTLPIFKIFVDNYFHAENTRHSKKPGQNSWDKMYGYASERRCPIHGFYAENGKINSLKSYFEKTDFWGPYTWVPPPREGLKLVCQSDLLPLIILPVCPLHEMDQQFMTGILTNSILYRCRSPLSVNWPTAQCPNDMMTLKQLGQTVSVMTVLVWV
jgi:hypothetical protein